MSNITKLETGATVALTNNEIMMSGAIFDRLNAMAEIMASGKCTVPDHLRGNKGDCFAVAMQSMQWGMNCFSVGQKTHVVSGRLGYEAQLVNAVVQASGAIRGRFHYEYIGEGQSVKCRVGAIPAGESEVVWGEWLGADQVQTKNSPLWKVNPKQQLGYLQVKNWARLYCPGAILGVYTPDELAELPAEPRNMGAAARVTPSIVEPEPQEPVEAIIEAMRAALTREELDAATRRGNVFAKGTPERKAVAAEYRRLLPEFEADEAQVAQPQPTDPEPQTADHSDFFAGMDTEEAREWGE